MAKIFEDKINIKPIDWVGPYIIIAALSMSMLGLVMLFSAGAVKGAQVLLNKQLVWLRQHRSWLSPMRFSWT